MLCTSFRLLGRCALGAFLLARAFDHLASQRLQPNAKLGRLRLHLFALRRRQRFDVGAFGRRLGLELGDQRLRQLFDARTRLLTPRGVLHLQARKQIRKLCAQQWLSDAVRVLAVGVGPKLGKAATQFAHISAELTQRIGDARSDVFQRMCLGAALTLYAAEIG